MKTHPTIPRAVMTAAVALLQQYIPNLTLESLEGAIFQSGIPGKSPELNRKLTRSECAQLLGVSVNSINRYIKSGRLKAVNISPRLVRIEPESVQNLLDHGVPEDEIIVPQCHGKAGSR